MHQKLPTWGRAFIANRDHDTLSTCGVIFKGSFALWSSPPIPSLSHLPSPPDVFASDHHVGFCRYFYLQPHPLKFGLVKEAEVEAITANGADGGRDIPAIVDIRRWRSKGRMLGAQMLKHFIVGLGSACRHMWGRSCRQAQVNI